MRAPADKAGRRRRPLVDSEPFAGESPVETALIVLPPEAAEPEPAVLGGSMSQSFLSLACGGLNPGAAPVCGGGDGAGSRPVRAFYRDVSCREVFASLVSTRSCAARHGFKGPGRPR